MLNDLRKSQSYRVNKTIIFKGEVIMKKKFILEGLDCAHCASKMETAISKLDGVKETSVNFMTKKLIIDGEDGKISSIVQETEKIIKDLEPDVVMKKA